MTNTLYLATEDGVVVFDLLGRRAVQHGLRGMTVRSVAAPPDGSNRVLAACQGRGVHLWVGRRWAEILKGVAHSVAWEGTSGLAYAGLRGVHVYVSRNGGRTWTEMEAAHVAMRGPGVPAPHMAGHPLDILTILVPHPNLLYVGVEAGGVLRSEDGGITWDAASRGLHPDIHALACDPVDPEIVYAATGHGLFKTVDGGGSWARSDQGIDRLYLAAVTVVPVQPRILLTAGAPDSPRNYNRPGGARACIFRSMDRAGAWVKMTRGISQEFAHEITAFISDPVIAERIGATTLGGELLLSEDAGYTWSFVARTLPSIWGATYASPPGRSFPRATHR